jgi:hypothetical protein
MRVSIGNSDPAVVKLATRWMRSLSEKPPVFWIQYHADQDLGQLREFWARELGAQPGSIRMQRKSNSNQLAGRTWRSRHGVLTVRICETRLRSALQAWMDQLRSEWQ